MIALVFLTYNVLIAYAESFTTLDIKHQDPLTSKNLEKARKFVNMSGLLDRVFLKRPGGVKHDVLLYTMQLTLAHMSLTAGLSSPASETVCFPQSQQMAYSTAARQPMFDGRGHINVELVLHIVNFFKYHFMRKEEQLCAPYMSLSECERPQGWAKMLQDGPQRLGKHWKGCYSK